MATAKKTNPATPEPTYRLRDCELVALRERTRAFVMDYVGGQTPEVLGMVLGSHAS